MSAEPRRIPWAEITAETDGTFSAVLFDGVFGKVWSGWKNTKAEAIAEVKARAKSITGQDVVNIFHKQAPEDEP